jgi:hypothetical protein
MCTVALGLFCGALCACERRGPTVGDASTTSATSPGEQAIELGADAGVTAEAPKPAVDAGAGRPSWVPKDASLTIVQAGDRDRNLGIVAPLTAPLSVAVDAGSCEVGIQVRGPKP